MLAPIRPVEAEEVSAADAAGRWLAEPVRAVVAAPPHDCSAMDGYAVRAEEVAGPATLPVRRTIFAGELPGAPLEGGEAVRIFTGAPLPPGADAVVREEAVAAAEGRATFTAPARPGENVRLAGEDVPSGGLALEAGVRLGARQRALLHAVGAATVRVRRRPRVRVLATGDEVVSGRTPDSNGLLVAALCEAAGAEVERLRVPDRLEALCAALAAAAAAGDLVITIGGVSVGARDLVPAALAALGAEVRVHRVRMKPGKPFLFATLGGKPVLCLPGSPSACLVTFEVFARPALLALAGAARLLRPAVLVRLAGPIAGRAGKARVAWATLDPDGRARPLGREAAQVRGPALAEALLVLPAEAGALDDGAEVTAWLLDEA